jgi:pyruvate/2-oxoglutarate dehydrogenase complex dihydrolipoamide acyltransferase (E2) component
VAESRTNEALEKLNRGIQESQQMVQQQTMRLAQDFFNDSAEELKQQIKENRATLEKLPGQIPGGQEESFQMLFQELMDNYAAVQQALNEAQQNVANLDTESLVRQGEIEATDAARREARELDLDLTQVEGTGSEGRITVDDVKKFAEKRDAPNASEAAQRRAEEMGVDLSQIEGTGSGGLITVKDVTSMAGEAQEQATDTAQQAAGQAQETADGAAGQAQEATGGDGSGEPKATNAARRKAEELGIDLSQIQGSGAGGLITIKDVVRS